MQKVLDCLWNIGIIVTIVIIDTATNIGTMGVWIGYPRYD